MRKSLFIFIIIGGMALGLGVFNTLLNSGAIPNTNRQAQAITQNINPTEEIIKPDPAVEPVGFSIPTLGIENVMVESVGLNDKKAMDIPKDENNAAWYNLGAKPGELGNAVIAAHYDNKDGSPSVFYDIKKLKPGDELIVKDKNGKDLTFAVTDVKTYELEKFPLQEVFGASSKARLNLITCEGTFNTKSRLYSHRLVVFSELKS